MFLGSVWNVSCFHHSDPVILPIMFSNPSPIIIMCMHVPPSSHYTVIVDPVGKRDIYMGIFSTAWLWLSVFDAVLLLTSLSDMMVGLWNLWVVLLPVCLTGVWLGLGAQGILVLILSVIKTNICQHLNFSEIKFVPAPETILLGSYILKT